jgi:hypothetical protein
VKAQYNGAMPSMFNFAGEEYILHKGFEYDLPTGCPHVQSLLGQKLLEPIN